MSKCVYIAPLDRVTELKSELKKIEFEKDNFLIAQRSNVFWAQNVWFDAKVVKIESIKKAADFLKSIQRNWYHYPLNCVRRTKLIQESLPRIKNTKVSFPSDLPGSNLGSFALLSETEMIYSPRCASEMPNGEFHFEDPPVEFPSEAYKKLWEALFRLGKFPGPGDLCIDLGSSPGSWTQALLELGASVVSVDKAALGINNPEKYSDRLVYLKKDAFKLDPQEFKNPTWVFSDIICYPDKLYELLLSWKSAHPRANFVFTIKFQSKWDPVVVKNFASLVNSKVLHLFHNKHELCFLYMA